MGLIFQEVKDLFDKQAEEILLEFTPAIKRSLCHTLYQERDDLEQEIKLLILEKIPLLQKMEVPGFWEFLYEYTEKDQCS
jgi:hypothetical protein